MDETLLRAREVARLLDISRSGAYRLFQDGEIETVRIGKSVRCRMGALEKYVATHSSEGRASFGTEPNALLHQ